MARARGFPHRSISVPMDARDVLLVQSASHAPNSGAVSETSKSSFKTFADQAVIAIENVRLFKELQARTERAHHSVGHAHALGEVGQAISSTLDLEKVLQTIVSRAVQLTGLDGGSIYESTKAARNSLLQGRTIRAGAARSGSPHAIQQGRRDGRRHPR